MSKLWKFAKSTKMPRKYQKWKFPKFANFLKVSKKWRFFQKNVNFSKYFLKKVKNQKNFPKTINFEKYFWKIVKNQNFSKQLSNLQNTSSTSITFICFSTFFLTQNPIDNLIQKCTICTSNQFVLNPKWLEKRFLNVF